MSFKLDFELESLKSELLSIDNDIDFLKDRKKYIENRINEINISDKYHESDKKISSEPNYIPNLINKFNEKMSNYYKDISIKKTENKDYSKDIHEIYEIKEKINDLKKKFNIGYKFDVERKLKKKKNKFMRTKRKSYDEQGKRVKIILDNYNYMNSEDIELLHKFYGKLFRRNFPSIKKLPFTRKKPNLNVFWKGKYANLIESIEKTDEPIDSDNYKKLLKNQIKFFIEDKLDQIIKERKHDRKKYELKDSETNLTKKELYEKYKKLFDEKFSGIKKRDVNMNSKKNEILEKYNELLK
jgi:hypothetical protein